MNRMKGLRQNGVTPVLSDYRNNLKNDMKMIMEEIHFESDPGSVFSILLSLSFWI